MKKADVKIGGMYYAKVSGHVVPITIKAERPGKGWDAINPATGRKLYIASALRLRGPAPHNPPRCGECANCVEVAKRKNTLLERFATTDSPERVSAIGDWREFAKAHQCVKAAAVVTEV